MLIYIDNISRAPRSRLSHDLLSSKLPSLRRLRHALPANMLLPAGLPSRNLRLSDRPSPLPQTTRCRGALRARPTPRLPVVPAALVFADIRVPRLPGNACRGPAPHACFAEEDEFLVGWGLLETELVLEVRGGKEERVGLRGYGEVYGGGDAVCAEFAGFADID